VVAICRRLEGLPLALELAAARIAVFSPSALLRRLSGRLALLTGGARDTDERHQTLRNTIEWSYDLLEAPDQQLFRRLAVFVDGCRPDATEAVCDSEPGDVTALDGLQSLVDKASSGTVPTRTENHDSGCWRPSGSTRVNDWRGAARQR